MKISIKEAYRYQNVLSHLLEKLDLLLMDEDYLMETKEVHQKSKVIASVADEELLQEKNLEYQVDAPVIIALYQQLLQEKLAVSVALSAAKKEVMVDIGQQEQVPLDCAIEHNKRQREFVEFQVVSLCNRKSWEQESTAQGTTFDKEGRLVQYPYPVRKIKTIQYDRHKMVRLKKKLLRQCDAVSEAIDRALLENIVSHQPVFDRHASLEEIFQSLEESVQA